ncbi:TPA: fimbrial protein [Providencia alcalifaciens]
MMNLKKKQLFIFMTVFFHYSAYALYIESDISSISSKQKFISKSYVNDTNETNLYTLSVYKILKPGTNEVSEKIENGEIIYTPTKKVLLPGEQDYFKIFYNGNIDDSERYYKLVISETPLKVVKSNYENRKSSFYLTINLESYLIIMPENMVFRYEFNMSDGMLKNTGNTYFRVILHEGCNDNDESAPSIFYLLPNQDIISGKLKIKSRKYIVDSDKFYPIGNCN